MEKQVALVACNGGWRNDSCSYGCIGCAACVSVCPADAIAINDCGVAEVDESLCLGCGACADATGTRARLPGPPARCPASAAASAKRCAPPVRRR